MKETFTCEQCGNTFIGQYNGTNFDKYCSTDCKNIVQAQADAWTYSGAWLKDLSAITNGIAAQQAAVSQTIVPMEGAN